MAGNGDWHDGGARELQALGALEEIRALKARYFRLMDTKHWQDWADVFTEDLRAWVEDSGHTYRGREEFVSSVSAGLDQATTVHHGHMPEIELGGWTEDGPTSATGIWAMFDYVEFHRPGRPFVLKGYGHYHETYRRSGDGRWRIASLELHRLRVDHPPPEPAPSPGRDNAG